MSTQLAEYERKRHFNQTPEPRGQQTVPSGGASFVIQAHAARRLHYDFRLELDGVLKSWAVPKGPSLDPSVKRLAVHVEDHPLDYAGFEGVIPQGNYGAGQVIVWDRGLWIPEGDARRGYREGHLKFRLQGEKLAGSWALVKSGSRGGDDSTWFLIKHRDDAARAGEQAEPTVLQPASVISGVRLGEPPAATEESEKSEAKEAGKLKEKSAGRKGRVDASLHDAQGEPGPGAPSASRAKTRAARSSAERGKDSKHVDGNGGSGKERAAGLEAEIRQAPAVPLPETLAPQLATLVDTPPRGDWCYEIKFDGYRILARVHTVRGKKQVKIFTRNGHDWTERYRRQAEAIAALPIREGWLDGEAVVFDSRDVPSFQALQNAFERGADEAIIVYLFDLPFHDGRDLRALPLTTRRALLHGLMSTPSAQASGILRFSENFDVPVDSLLEQACRMSLEGVIGKRADSPYVCGRSPAWIKLKCKRRQEFVIGGYTEPSGSRNAFGALLLGVYDERQQLRYAGRVGTGFDHDTLRQVLEAMRPHAAARAPFADAPRARGGVAIHWLEPRLVAEVEFSEWTADGAIRHASFVALRSDKNSLTIGREEAVSARDIEKADAQASATPRQGGARSAGKGAAAPARKRSRAASKPTAARAVSAAAEAPLADTVAGVRISHPERVIDPGSGLHKLELARYYEAVSEWMLPHLRERPVALVRAPQGVGGELFFQKHSERYTIPGIEHLERALDPEHPPLMVVSSAQALAGVAQMNCIELHTWNARASDIEKPDRIVFDLDPDPKLDWQAMCDAARAVRLVLDELGLRAFCKTSGGKGLHVVVPLGRYHGWEQAFEFSRAVAQFMERSAPQRYSATMGAKHRIGRIFIDYLRNRRGASTVAAYSARARPGLGVSVPVDWDELDVLGAADHWNVRNLEERLRGLQNAPGGAAGTSDPWRDYGSVRQRLSAAMLKRLNP